ncbi:MAG TPA: response regulator [Rhodanobacter sp.]|nr:response regulator [Rhodanobacter sp.]
MRPNRSNRSWLADQPLQRKMTLAISLLLGLFLLTSGITLHSLHQQESNRHWAMHTYQVLLELDDVQRVVQGNQVDARDYMLSPGTNQLALFKGATRDLHDRLAELRRLTADNVLQQSRIDSIEALAARWQQEITDNAINPLTALDLGNPAAGVERQRIQSSYMQHRTVRIEDLSMLLDQMTAEENLLLVTRKAQLDRTLTTTMVINAVAILLGLILGIVVIRLTSRLITRPLRNLTDLLNRLTKHDHNFEVDRLDRRDEIGEIARTLQVFKQMSLDTQAQTWIKAQVSGISHLLLQAPTHKEFAQWFISELVPLCEAGVGLFYSYDDARHRLDLLGSYGLRLRNRSSDHYMPGEGLVGQCAVERKAIILDNVPADYLHIDSGSGEALPGHLAILPVLYRDTLIGVLELAGFTALSPLHRQLLEELLPLVALTLENLNRTISTHDLLLRTQEQADELRVSELVMRQQKQVLRDNNDALHAKTAELEQQSERLIASEDELRRQADELQASNAELRVTTDELARASQYKSEFLANMSHELRTPLNSLLILSRSLADNDSGNLNGEQVESARVIHDAGNSLLYLINDILDLSKIEAGKMELIIDELSLTELERRLRRSFAHVAEQKGLGFTLEIGPGLPAILHTDAGKLEQITNNLLSNAFKFTVRGGVSVRIGRPGSELAVPAALRDQPLLALTVSDTGIGIPRDKFERIFNAFEQVDAGTSRQFGGTGLGLAISRRMALLLGGDIVLHSESGRGSAFTVLLPETPPAPSLESADAAPRPNTATPARATSPHLLPDVVDDDRHSLLPGQTTILVIEDDPVFARILIDMIHRKGYRALAAADGESGLLLARQHRPSGILLDVALPTMDGWAVLDQLRADDATRTIPVHCISVTDEAPRALARGAIGFLTKPVSRESIGLALERLLLVASGQQAGDNGGSAVPATAGPPPPVAGLSGHRVLLVDDDMRNLFALSKVLRGWGLQVSLAQDGHKALRMLADEAAPELLLMDIMMPGMDGYEVLRTIRAQPRFAQLPIIALTAKAMHGDREKCMAMGASDYLSKPIDIDRLAAMLRSWLPR